MTGTTKALQRLLDLIRALGVATGDVADGTSVVTEMGQTIAGTGVGRGATKAVDAANGAMSSLARENTSFTDARGVLIYVTGGIDLTLREISESASIIHAAAHHDAHIIMATVVEPGMEGETKITVIASSTSASVSR